MPSRGTTTRRSLIGAQMLGTLLVFLCVALAPPAQGMILLVPVSGQTEAQIVTLALTHGASLVQRGPLPSSVVVYGTRHDLLAPLARAGVLTLAGGAVGCRPGQTGGAA